MPNVRPSAKKTGRLFVFEGSDGVGKTTISEKVSDRLNSQGIDVLFLSFPGKEPHTIGDLVYKIHHNSKEYGIEKFSPASLQTLHIAAHIDCIENRILPALNEGKTVILDRFWWSTVAYGLASGIPYNTVEAMINLEKTIWDNILPDQLFLITRNKPFREELDRQMWSKVCKAYNSLYDNEKVNHPISIVRNTRSLKSVVNDTVRLIGNGNLPHKGSLRFRQDIFDLPLERPKTTIIIPKSHWLPTKITEVFDTYWRFAAERQSIFFKRFIGEKPPWTKDHILQQYKFTNAYRASDRVSQYLIQRVIYEGDQSPDEVFFRIILFKTFNKIETWKILLENFGEITWAGFDFKAYDRFLTESRNNRVRIYSGAYIMPSGGKSFGHGAKHSNNLELIQRMMIDELPSKICDAKSMQEVFDLLRSYPMIGDFLAYQYASDINYSNMTDFSEMSFVVPGPGAKDGLQKCFSDPAGLSEIDLIKLMAERQEKEFERLGLDFQDLWGRKLQLIDCQNLFCEVDKYARVAHPEVMGITGRNRIKQKFRATDEKISFYYPPKWKINDNISKMIKKGSP
ncbi:conserved hypothetical protein [Desulfosarcina cetonica]|uniref:nucleotide kinase domain-containing protein n=1 Tax=Desulfosarcina cetonica TaxID=90730 RepID=UPI0009FB5BB9|nr:nucleotide kinase domain-containing protein [Desulfosarcina cetonica]VTR66943.1 conserved hypothetical protein [Desulfosarcina cetonica]